MSLDYVYFITLFWWLFERALKAVDEALSCAAEANGKISKEADEKFQKATDLLGDYERNCYFKNEDPTVYEKNDRTVIKRMGAAKSEDKSSSTILSKLKEKFHSKVRVAPVSLPHTNTDPQIHEDESSVPTAVVEFHLLESPTDKEPTIVERECWLTSLFLVSDAPPRGAQ
jgi:hypothetical protein